MGHVTRIAPRTAVSGPRLAVRAVIVVRGRLLLVNAYPGEASDLWCAPGGGAERGHEPRRQPACARCARRPASRIRAGAAPRPSRSSTTPTTGFHQVDLIYPARLAGPAEAAVLRDPAGVVNRLRWVDAGRARRGCGSSPTACARLAFGPAGAPVHRRPRARWRPDARSGVGRSRPKCLVEQVVDHRPVLVAVARGRRSRSPCRCRPSSSGPSGRPSFLTRKLARIVSSSESWVPATVEVSAL